MSNPHDQPASTAGAGSGAANLTIVELAYHHPDARCLVQALFDEQVNRYGYADPADADPELYRPPHGLFLVGYHGRRPVTCGGFRRHDADTVEVKKMYTVPDHRGHGHGLAIISELERRAADAGARRAILETGVRNSAALALYTGLGYQPTARYVPGRDPAINRAFVKNLLAAAVG